VSAYIIRRLLWAIPTLLGAVTIIFLVMRVLPGDVAMVIMGGEEEGFANPAELEALRQELGVNRPIYEQYASWMWDLLRGSLGKSLWTGESVWHEISIRMPYTATLIVLSIIISLIVAIPVGVISALKQDTWLDYGLRSFAIAGMSIPSFWFGLLLLMLTLNAFHWSPPIEYAPVHKDPLTAIQQLILPAIALGYRSAAGSARMMRSSMLEVMREDYVRTARAKGLKERTVIYLHALKNAVLPVITVFGLEVIMVFSSAVIVETIFNVPGMGRLLIDGINRRDVNLVQGEVAFIIAFVLVVNLVVDVTYAWVDPRIRYR